MVLDLFTFKIVQGIVKEEGDETNNMEVDQSEGTEIDQSETREIKYEESEGEDGDITTITNNETDLKELQCEECGKQCKNKNAFKGHMFYHKNIQNGPKITCVECNIEVPEKLFQRYSDPKSIIPFGNSATYFRVFLKKSIFNLERSDIKPENMFFKSEFHIFLTSTMDFFIYGRNCCQKIFGDLPT